MRSIGVKILFGQMADLWCMGTCSGSEIEWFCKTEKPY